MYRARCHMVLSTDDDHPLFLQHANEAVRLLDEDIRDVVEPETFPKVQYKEALRLQQAAQEEAAERMAAFEARESEEEEEVDESASVDEGQEQMGEGVDVGEEMGEAEGLSGDGETSAAPVASAATQRLLRDAASFGATSRHGLMIPSTLRTVSTRTASNQSQGCGGAPSRRSGRLASGNAIPTPLKEGGAAQEEKVMQRATTNKTLALAHSKQQVSLVWAI